MATRLKDLQFKIRPADTAKVEAAKVLIREGINVPALLDALKEAG